MEKEPEKNKSRVGEGMAIGVALGAAIGVALDNTSTGIAVGVAIGAAIGAGLDWQRRKRNGQSENSETPDESSSSR